MKEHPLRPTESTAGNFVPYKGWENYKQSDLLEPWPKSTLELVNVKTGLNFPEGTKGFPLELFYWFWKDHEWFLNDFFDTSVSNKIFLASKNALKTAFDIQVVYFLMMNFDFAEVALMTKYNNALGQPYESLKGYGSFWKDKSGLDFTNIFNFEDELNTRVFNIKLERVWKKRSYYNDKDGKERFKWETHFNRNVYFRSFDHADKIANFPKPDKDQSVVYVNLIEPALMSDDFRVTAAQLEETWRVNRSSLFRYSDMNGRYSQMIAEMNNWDQENPFIQISNIILPFDKDNFGENGTYRAIDKDLNYSVRRLNRYSNTLLKLEGNELKEHDSLKNTNPELFDTIYWGAPYKEIAGVGYSYLSHMNKITFGEFPSSEEIYKVSKELKKFPELEDYYINVGIDYGTNHATTAKLSLFIPNHGKLYRKHIFRICNFERKKKNEMAIGFDEMLDLIIEEIAAELVPYVKQGVLPNPFIIYGDGGSKGYVDITDTKLVKLGLGDHLICEPSRIFGTNNRSEKLQFDNYVHSSGIAVYDFNNEITVNQYKSAKSKRTNPEIRDENNQMLDEIDATNIAEDEIMDVVYKWKYMKLRNFAKGDK